MRTMQPAGDPTSQLSMHNNSSPRRSNERQRVATRPAVDAARDGMTPASGTHLPKSLLTLAAGDSGVVNRSSTGEDRQTIFIAGQGRRMTILSIPSLDCIRGKPAAFCALRAKTTPTMLPSGSPHFTARSSRTRDAGQRFEVSRTWPNVRCTSKPDAGRRLGQSNSHPCRSCSPIRQFAVTSTSRPCFR